MTNQVGWFIKLERDLSSADMWALLPLIGEHYEIVIVDQQLGSERRAKSIKQYSRLGIADQVAKYEAHGLLYVVCYNGSHNDPKDKVTFVILPDGPVELVFSDNVHGSRRKKLTDTLSKALKGHVGRWNE